MIKIYIQIIKLLNDKLMKNCKMENVKLIIFM